MEKVDFLTKKIETTTPIPFERAWSREFKNVLFLFRSPPMLRNINLKVLKAALQPKIYAFSNGHYEGPIDFFDQSLLT